MSDEETITALRLALIKIQRHTHMSRYWGGMGWKFLPMPPFRVKDVENLCIEALEASLKTEEEDG